MEPIAAPGPRMATLSLSQPPQPDRTGRERTDSNADRAVAYADMALASARAFDGPAFARAMTEGLRRFFQETYQMLGDGPREAAEKAERIAGKAAAPPTERASRLAAEAAERSGFRLTRLSIAVSVETLDVAVQTAEGALSVSIRRVSLSLSLTTVTSGGAGGILLQDPLAIDLDGDGIETDDLARAGRRFDLDANGRAERSAWIAGDDALLALDRNGNGRIDDGTELFGEAGGFANGLEALAIWDHDGNGVIDRSDPVFGRLKLLFADGRLRPLAEAGVARLDLSDPRWTDEPIAGGRIAARFAVGMADGTARTGYDLLFETTA